MQAGGSGRPSHDDGFRSYQQRMQDCGYTRLFPYAMVSENRGLGQASGAEFTSSLIQDPDHNPRLLELSYRAVGL